MRFWLMAIEQQLSRVTEKSEKTGEQLNLLTQILTQFVVNLDRIFFKKKGNISYKLFKYQV